jgi:signal transduction histidine kinase
MARLAGMARYGDALLAAVLSVLVAIELLGLGSPGSLGTWADSPETAAALLVALAFTASLAVRRRLPLMCLLLAVVAAVALPVSPFEASLALTAAMAVATYSAGAHTRGPAAVSGAVGVIVLGASIVLREPAAATDDLVDLLLPLGPWLAGIAIRVRRDREDLLEQRAAALEREREAQERAAVAAERGRIARELHDVVAHAISIVVLQARGARRVLADDPAATSAALDSIEETASNALAEMRRVVHVLRDEGEAGELAPQPSIGQLDVLVEQVRDAGLDVDVAVEGEPVDLPAGVSLSGYRIVQEALTNALRHAGPGVTRVVIRYLPGEVELEIEDRGGGPPPVDPKGLGLLGMQERVALLGGSLDAGPTDGGGYRVRARLPLEPVGS